MFHSRDRLDRQGAIWRASTPDVVVGFAGLVAAGDRTATLALTCASGDSRLVAPTRLARLRQVHSADVVRARTGDCGSADALWTDEPELALAIATADCVPVLLAGHGRVAAVHAGWRGLVAGIIPRAVESLGGGGSGVRAWIGPAIGPCCYEVGEEVAAAIAGASDEGALRRHPDRRPHANLVAAARWQLAQAGVAAVAAVETCTRCSPELLWSYRRDGTAAGRNLAFIWRTAASRSEAQVAASEAARLARERA